MDDSKELAYTCGWKYRVEQTFYYRFKYDFYPSGEYNHPHGYYSLLKIDGHWTGVAFRGCCYDGPSGPMPDVAFMMGPSLIHDLLHWLIAKGIISTEYNDLIDKELERAIMYYKVSPPVWQGGKLLKKPYSKLIRQATNLVDEFAGHEKPVITIKLL